MIDFIEELVIKKKEQNLEKKEISRLFGTDGIRGTANQFPMTPDLVMRVGQALGYWLRRKKDGNRFKKVVVGKDTRLSGYMVEQALTSGLNAMGVHVEVLGPMPTPGIGFLTQSMRADAGVVISASHNAYMDNGIKIFGSDGFKIPEGVEREIEELVADYDLNSVLAGPMDIGRSKRIDDASGRYIVHAKSAFPIQYSLDGLRVVLDCAHGATYKVAPAIFHELGAETIVLANNPNGFNINDKAGALHPNHVREAVVQYRADVGISLDGDGDRVIIVDESGNVVNGDHILGICALDMKSRGVLKKNTVVCTQMSKFGLDQLMAKNDIRVIRTQVGDRCVVEEMKRNGFVLGGEQSGHIILLEHSTTGDGCIAALNVLAAMRRRQCRLSQLAREMSTVPQVLTNLRVNKRLELDSLAGYQELLAEIETELGGEGRIFVRYSGTEPLVRILMEGPHREQLVDYSARVSEFLEKNLS